MRNIMSQRAILLQVVWVLWDLPYLQPLVQNLALRKGTVIAIAGDGGFQMTLQELGTIMQTSLNVKIIVLNNQFLGMVRQWQELFNDRRYSFVDIQSPDFVELAKSYRIAGQKVTERSALKKALKDMLDSPEAYLLDIMVGKENNVFPMVPQGCSVSEIRLS